MGGRVFKERDSGLELLLQALLCSFVEVGGACESSGQNFGCNHTAFCCLNSIFFLLVNGD